jgi:hypothetical protein
LKCEYEKYKEKCEKDKNHYDELKDDHEKYKDKCEKDKNY